MIKVCPQCQLEFTSSVRSRVFCSVKCSVNNRKKDVAYLEKLRKPKTELNKKDFGCAYCGFEFSSKKERKYCSTKCSNQDRLLGKGYLIPIFCKECKKQFKPVRSSMKYCSTTCSTQGTSKDPVFVEKLKIGCAKRSENQEYIEKLSELAKNRWADAGFREKMEKIFDSDEWQEKSTESYLTKDYMFPSGRRERVQGYEDRAIDELLQEHSEDDIVVNKQEIRKLIGTVFYHDEEGIKHRYIPDIYVKSENLIVEVKSEWTYRIKQEVNEIKKEACLRKGHNFCFKIY